MDDFGPWMSPEAHLQSILSPDELLKIAMEESREMHSTGLKSEKPVGTALETQASNTPTALGVCSICDAPRELHDDKPARFCGVCSTEFNVKSNSPRTEEPTQENSKAEEKERSAWNETNWHQANSSLRNDRLFGESTLKDGYKKCPSCGTVMKRTYNLNHMRCSCKEHWCYRCEVLVDNYGPKFNHHFYGNSCGLFVGTGDEIAAEDPAPQELPPAKPTAKKYTPESSKAEKNDIDARNKARVRPTSRSRGPSKISGLMERFNRKPEHKNTPASSRNAVKSPPHGPSKIDGLMQRFNQQREEEKAHQQKRKKLKVGTLCSALYHEDGEWYDAEIKQILKGGQFEVLFVDYGNLEAVDLSDIRLIGENDDTVQLLKAPVSIRDKLNERNKQQGGVASKISTLMYEKERAPVVMVGSEDPSKASLTSKQKASSRNAVKSPPRGPSKIDGLMQRFNQQREEEKAHTRDVSSSPGTSSRPRSISNIDKLMKGFDQKQDENKYSRDASRPRSSSNIGDLMKSFDQKQTPDKVVSSFNPERQRAASEKITRAKTLLLARQDSEHDELCPICFCDYEEGDKDFIVDKCGHRFHEECVKGHVKMCMDNNKLPILCPSCQAGDSKKPKNRGGIFMAMGPGAPRYSKKPVELSMAQLQTILDERQTNLLAKKYEENYKLQDKSMTTCSTVDCGMSLCLIGMSCKNSEFCFKCPKCKRYKCKQCETDWHENQTCEQAKENTSVRNDQLFEESRLEAGYKKCPNCGIILERTDGCNHMTCRCKEHWCYRCEVLVDNYGPKFKSHFDGNGCSLFMDLGGVYD